MRHLDPVLRNTLFCGGIIAADDPSGDPPAGDSSDKSPEKSPANPPAPESYKVVVDGEEKTFTLDELKDAATKGEGADKRFREAAEIKKQAERGMRIDSLFSKLNASDEPDPKDVNELAGLLGINPEIFQGTAPSQDPGGGAPTKKIKLEDLSQDLQDQLGFDRKEAIHRAEQKIRDEVRKLVDKDDIIGKMNNVATETGNKEFLDSVTEMVHEDVLRKIRNDQPYGPELIASSLQAARTRLKKFGTPEKVATPKTLIMGMGQPGGEPLAIQPDEPIERVESSETGYSDNFAKRFFQRMAKSRLSKA